ncbi:putative bifunctional diguanylate cyclase/phosphodiesterase [Pseudofrankia inefficax]|uniref:putative bifunctional diguanylate cyclase/phosphodiesterase n=1 Tax=Pseudofrankia inefficax (strain DSM 45817 / CECT 9037 / DDB 130130 / EuI1c) TaxID=298654 RepID=UPI001E47695B|nr:diguanylate cyclase [Pseudofrankia inefficax]
MTTASWIGAAYILVITICALTLPSRVAAMVTGSASAVACLAVAISLGWTGWKARGADRRWRILIGAAAIPTAVATGWHIGWISGHGTAIPAHVPWAADGFLLIIVLYLAGVLTFPTDPLGGEKDASSPRREGFHWYVITALDSLVVVGALFLLAWLTILKPIAEMRHFDTAGLVSSLASVAGYLLLLASLVFLSVFRQPRSPFALALLGAGLSGMMASTVIYFVVFATGGHRTAPIVDVVSALAWLLILLAGLVPIPESGTPVRRGRPRTLQLRAALPYLALGAAGVLVLIQLIVNSAIDSVERSVLVGLLLVVLIRQVMTLGENTRLLASVEASRQELRYQALHDPLTGLPNRTLFAERLHRALALRDNRPFSLVYCDLDDFKRVNDTLGHAAGDELLRTTAARLREGVRPGDTVARLGGDEFAILLEREHRDPEALCRRLASMIRAPTTLKGQPHPVGASLGLVVADSSTPPEPDALLRDADLAMYAAKRQGKGGLIVFRPELTTAESAPQIRSDLEQALRGDDRHGTVKVLYHPVVELRTGHTSALDAVPLWNHHQLGEVAPDLLDRIADEAGLTMTLVGRVLREVCRDVAEQGLPEPDPVFVRVPVGRGLDKQPADVGRLLADWSVSHRAIILVLANSGGVVDLTAAARMLQRIVDSGIRLALDGVGGMASAFGGWHNNPPVEIIRLDRCFTDPDATSAPTRTRIVREAVLGVASRLGLTVVATGIRNPVQARELAEAGCPLGAGPLYGSFGPGGVAPTAAADRSPCHPAVRRHA